MTLAFEAAAVAAHRDDALGVDSIVFAENHDGSGRCLEIQRPLRPDEQDAALGHDTYCLVRDAGATHYGGVTAWSLEDGSLTLDLDAPAAATLGVPRFRIAVPDDAHGVIADALPRLLA